MCVFCHTGCILILESSHGIGKETRHRLFFIPFVVLIQALASISISCHGRHTQTHADIVPQGSTLQSTSAPLQLLGSPSTAVTFSAGRAIPRASLNKLVSPAGSGRKCNSIRETTQSDAKIFHPWWPREPLAVTHVAPLALPGTLRLDRKVNPSRCTFYLPHTESTPFSLPILLICE